MKRETLISTALLLFGTLFLAGRMFLTEHGMGKAYVRAVEIKSKEAVTDISWKKYENATQRQYLESVEQDPDQTQFQFSISRTLGIWVAALFTLFIFSFLYRDNPFYKIASFFVNWDELIKEICKTKKPIIMSTGCSTIEEIDHAVEIIREHKNPFCLMHAVSSYPTEDKDLNLNVIQSLQERYNCPVGYSGHEKGVGLTAASVALGACVIERHFTLDRTMKGPDHASSVEPTGLKLIIERAKRMHDALGSSEINVYDCELANRKKFRGY